MSVDEVLAAYPWLETHEALLTTLVAYIKRTQTAARTRSQRCASAESPASSALTCAIGVIDRSAHSVETRDQPPEQEGAPAAD